MKQYEQRTTNRIGAIYATDNIIGSVLHPAIIGEAGHICHTYKQRSIHSANKEFLQISVYLLRFAYWWRMNRRANSIGATY